MRQFTKNLAKLKVKYNKTSSRERPIILNFIKAIKRAKEDNREVILATKQEWIDHYGEANCIFLLFKNNPMFWYRISSKQILAY